LAIGRSISGESTIAEHVTSPSTKPVVSVILPTYNRAGLVASAIDSVVRQTFDCWELVVVDDASDDETEQVVARYRDPRLRYVRRPVNGGVSAAQNTGIEHARGELVVFLHSDDELLPTKLEQQVRLFACSSDDVGAVESGLEFVRPDRVERWPPGLDGAVASDVISYRARAHLSGLMLRHAVAQQLRFDEQLRGAEDRDFCFRLLESTAVAVSQEPLSRVCTSHSRLSHQDMAPNYMYLLRKYHDTIASDRRVHADWHYRIARAHASAGRIPEARRALRESLRLDRWRLRRRPLWLASFAGDRPLGAAFGVQVRVAQTLQEALAHNSRAST
jgi:glycosyltransferase involved in cell wall biosynthesis